MWVVLVWRAKEGISVLQGYRGWGWLKSLARMAYLLVRRRPFYVFLVRGALTLRTEMALFDAFHQMWAV